MKQLLKYGIVSIFLIVNVCSAFSQTVNFSGFSLIQSNKDVLLYWVIDSGFTCNGITIWRSVDSINYEKAGEILGVCGSSSSPIPYKYTDLNPIYNTTNYYKIRLGLNQFSEPQSIFVDYVDPGKISLSPNPANNNISISFNKDFYLNSTIIIIDALGRQIFKQENVNENMLNIDLENYSSGYYTIFLIDNNRKVLKEKFIISR